MHKHTSKEEILISITATMEEWQNLERLVTSYRQQCRAMRRYNTLFGLLTDFQRRFTKQTGIRSPDDYFI